MRISEWKDENVERKLSFLSLVCQRVNAAANESFPIEYLCVKQEQAFQAICEYLFFTLNERRSSFVGTTPTFRKMSERLFYSYIDCDVQNQICDSGPVDSLAKISPYIQNQSLVRVWDGPASSSAPNAAIEDHENFERVFNGYKSNNVEAKILMKNLAGMLCLIRNNISHVGKSTTERDRDICNVYFEISKMILMYFVGAPRLAVYLPLDQRHQGHSGCSGKVQGTLEHEVLKWNFDCDSWIDVHVIDLDSSSGANDLRHRDDSYGPEVARILVPVKIDGHLELCWTHACRE